MIENIDEDALMKLKHIIASHHGLLEYGSPVLPMTPEAMAVHYIDQMDSRLNAILSLKNESKDNDWSEYQKIFGRYFFLK